MLKKWYKKISIVTIMILVISLFMPISLFASQKVLGENMQITAAERIFGSNRYETAAKIAPDLTELVHTSDQFKCERSP